MSASAQRTDTAAHLYPTLLEAAELPALPDQHIDGVSLLPLFAGSGGVDRDAIFWHYPHYANQGGRPAASVRCGDWKLIEHYEDGRLELFDVRSDRQKAVDRADDQPTRVRQLHDRLVAWRTEIEALIPKRNANWRPDRHGPGVDPAHV